MARAPVSAPNNSSQQSDAAPEPTDTESAHRSDLGKLTWKWRLIGVVILAALLFGVYAKSLHYEMIFDDAFGIVENESIHQLWPLFGAGGEYGPLNPQPNTPFSARPLVSLAMAINYHFGGDDPYGYRLTHIAIHFCCGLLLWAIVSMTLGERRFSNSIVKHRHLLGFSAAAVWMLHPVHNETVIYLTQRTELMMGLFYFLTMYFSIRYFHSRSTLHRSVYVIAAGAACIAGMLCKEMIASVPAMVLIYEWLFVGRRPFEIVKRSWPLYVALSLNWVVAYAIYSSGYVTPLGGFNNSISAVDWWLTQANAFFVYCKLTIWPWPLVLHYHVPTLSEFSTAWPGVVGLSLYAVLTGWLLWRRNPIGYAMIWFFAVLSPTLIVPLPREEISERRLYVATAVIAPCLVVGLFGLIQYAWATIGHRKNASTADGSSHPPSWILLISQMIVAGVVVAYMAVSTSTMSRLKDPETIWAEVLKHQPNGTYALANQGVREFMAGKREEGFQKMHRAYTADPEYRPVVLAYASALKELNRISEAIEVYQRATKSMPDSFGVHYDLACALDQIGKPFAAANHYRETIRLCPEHHAAHTNLALFLMDQHNYVDAMKHFELAVDFEPDYQNCMNLMNIYLRRGENEKAAGAARKLLAAARREGKTDVVDRIEQGLKDLEKLSK